MEFLDKIKMLQYLRTARFFFYEERSLTEFLVRTAMFFLRRTEPYGVPW